MTCRVSLEIGFSLDDAPAEHPPADLPHHDLAEQEASECDRVARQRPAFDGRNPARARGGCWRINSTG
jgi:hypothetical protein